MGERKHGDLCLSAPGKPCFHTEKASTGRLAKTGSTQALALSTQVLLPVAATAAYVYRRRRRGTPDAMAEPGRRWPPQLVSEVLGTVRLPDPFVGALPDRFLLTGPGGTPLSADGQKGGGIHAFLGRLTARAAPVPGIADIALLGFDQYRGAHILHFLFYVPVVPYNPD